ncbi:hypothetical protein DMENIID0001_037040 [Sergentomyia squamirostris]
MRTFSILFFINFATVLGQNFSQQIHFIVFQDNQPVNTSQLWSKNPVDLGLCKADDDLAVIVHGWMESCSQEWLVDLVSNLTIYRGGCIICMDYSHFANNPDYFSLVDQFNDIREVLHEQLVNYGDSGLNANKTYMFGFSMGAHLCLQAASMLGERIVKEIDVCDPAGPGFFDMPDATISAQNVQCIHTSADKGTLKRNCHQNWNMGICGLSQIAAGPYPKGSHGLCPYFYNSAFNNTFLTISRPFYCLLVGLLSPSDVDYPENFQMGYMEMRKKKVSGMIYAKTSESYPYN